MDLYDLIVDLFMVAATALALINYICERRAVRRCEELEEELDEAKKYQKSLENSKVLLENSIFKLKNTEFSTKKLQISNKSYKLVTKIEIPLEVFVYPSDTPCVNDCLKEKIALSIAKMMVDDDIMTISWEDDGLNMTRHAEASIKVLCDGGEHWF